jgi:putative transposase
VSSMRNRRYPTDLTDAECGRLAPPLSSPEPCGRPRKHSVREVLDAIFYVVRGGCAWRLLPHDFPPRGTAYYWFRRWRLDGLWQRILVALRRATRQKEGRDLEASAAIVDSQSVRIAEESSSNKGYDAAKRVSGRKRHLLVDTSGLLLAERVTPANISDNRGARELVAGLVPLMPRLERIWADSAYAGEKLRSWCAEHTGWQLEVVPRNSDSSTFAGIPRRWVVERSIAWICRNRRLAKDYERKVQTSECWLKVAMIRLMLKRLGRN